MPIFIAPFVGMPIEGFHDFLKTRPLIRLQCEEFEADSTVATPADHRLLDREWSLAAGCIHAEFKRCAGKDVDRTEDAATS